MVWHLGIFTKAGDGDIRTEKSTVEQG